MKLLRLQTTLRDVKTFLKMLASPATTSLNMTLERNLLQSVTTALKEDRVYALWMKLKKYFRKIVDKAIKEINHSITSLASPYILGIATPTLHCALD